ncbi:tRNA-modifying protein YgfZ [Tatumella saanichensis]|uniref:tRNA-modifying protein YgfZ n=1 Tax=Tatumella saanichensis TaxID=480813 RepID=UPI0004A28E6B|nr:tRNA-modifying protein YgfZ [Tatumella saanichensis]
MTETKITPPAVAEALPLTVIALDDWALVTARGQDSTSYLQGQLTLDVAALAEDDHRLAGHCDAKGKMWSSLRLFHDTEGYGYLLRRQVREQQLTQLKKYAVFAKVTLSADDSRMLTGIAGAGAREALAPHFPQLPDSNRPRVIAGDNLLLWLPAPTERFLLIAGEETTASLCQELNHAQLAESHQWLALDIAAGLPVIDPATAGEFIPQATNLQALDAISFKKGCYTGQEMVARAKYRGANKRALYWLAGAGTTVPQAGDALELQMGDRWRKTGTVLAAVKLDDGTLSLQAVLNNDLEADAVLRPEGDDSGSLNIQPLPYSLESND